MIGKTLAPGTKLGPYEILAPIGAGGMGEVWKARDTRLGRIVAIKKVKEQHSERFKQEARTIAALNHSNICQLFDIGPDYLVLEYVEGKPLSSPLPEQEAVRLAIQIATALEAAHKKGIIHRDLKPGNIMVTDEGSVKLLDFGLAKLYEQDASLSSLPTADMPATQAGAIVGTVAYMSPEQAQGLPADARSDIFSFGLVLYEMLSGRRAFSGESNPAILAALLRDEPAPSEVSQSIEKIVRRCLVKQAPGRYQTISEVKAALEQASAEKLAVSAAGPQPSIAVLPFVNMSGDKEQEYFSDGLTEEIINALTKIPELKVTARTSAFAFRGKDQDVTRIAHALRAKTLLEGSVRKAGNRIRVTAQLINAADGYHLWSERFDREMTDVFAIQDEICEAIVENLRLKLTASRMQVKRYTENIEAYNLYLKGRYQATRYSSSGFSKAREYYEQSLALDGNYIPAWYGLARFYFLMGLFGLMPPKTANAQSGLVVRKILELDDTLPEAHSMTAILRAVDFDWTGSETEFRRALELGPRSAEVWAAFSYHYLLPLRQLDESIEASRRAIELDPLSPFLQYQLGNRYYLEHQYDRAAEQMRNALEIDPQYHWANMTLGFIEIHAGNFDKGVSLCEASAHVGGSTPALLGWLGWAYARAGRIDEAQKLLGEMLEQAENSCTSPSSVAAIFLGLDEIDQALDWFEKAIEERDGMIHQLHVGPLCDPLRSHPRYHALLRKMNLEP